MAKEKGKAKPTGRKTGGWVGRNLIALGISLTLGAGFYLGHVLEGITKIHLLSALENRLVDLRFVLRGPRATHNDVAIVAIDSKSTEAIGRWPWSRVYLAKVIDRLREDGASAVVFDVLLSEPQGVQEAARLKAIADAMPAVDPAREDTLAAARSAIKAAFGDVLADKVLAKSFEDSINADKALVVFAFDFVFAEDLEHTKQLGKVLSEADEQVILDLASYASRDENVSLLRKEPPKLALGVRPMVAELAGSCAALGYANPVHDIDASVRRERLLVVYSPAVRQAYSTHKNPMEALLDPKARVQAFLPLSMAGVVTHRRLSVDKIVLDLPRNEIRLPREASEGGGTNSYQFSPSDGTMRIDFYGASGTFPTYPFIDVLENKLTDRNGNAMSGESAFKGKMVFVGATDPGLADFFPTPFTSRLPGVEKHANTAENLLHGQALRTHADDDIVILICTLLAAILVAAIAGNLGSVTAGVIVPGITFLWLAWTYHDFVSKSLLWNWTVPGLTVAFGFTGVTAFRQVVEAKAKRQMEARSEFIQQTFGRYLSDEVVKKLVESPEGLQLGGEKKRITILMSDLRGFTSLCERSSPEIVISMLNKYLGTMADLVLKHKGTVDEFIGDAILALFGAPEKGVDDAERATACAIEMQLAMTEVNKYCRENGLPEVEMGIALNTGDVIVGNIGSERRSKYGVVGSAINLTARIESYTVGGQILISGETLKEAGPNVTVGDLVEVKAKGVAEPVPAYDLRAIGGAYNLTMTEVKETLINLSDPILVRVFTLDGKHVSETAIDASFVRMSKIGADLVIPDQLPVQTNLKIHVLDSSGTPVEGDLYVKVVDREASPGATAVRFTSNPPTIKKFFKPFLEDATHI